MLDGEKEARYPRLWQMSEGVIDLNIVFLGAVDQSEEGVREFMRVQRLIMSYYHARSDYLFHVAHALRELAYALEHQDVKRARKSSRG